MRIWDINPGYLNRQSLLGEHRELHGIVSIIKYDKKGYSRHPETLRWINYGWAIKQRHKLLSAEMSLRGYTDKSPVNLRSNKGQWPELYIDLPHTQIELLKNKYSNKEKGRIPLPGSAKELWEHHRFSVMARNSSLFAELEKTVSKRSPNQGIADLSKQLIEILRKPPAPDRMRSTLLHMWGYVSASYTGNMANFQQCSSKRLLNEIQTLAIKNNEPLLIHSTALSEFETWI